MDGTAILSSQGCAQTASGAVLPAGVTGVTAWSVQEPVHWREMGVDFSWSAA